MYMKPPLLASSTTRRKPRSATLVRFFSALAGVLASLALSFELLLFSLFHAVPSGITTGTFVHATCFIARASSILELPVKGRKGRA
jgi:hypothetical protein